MTKLKLIGIIFAGIVFAYAIIGIFVLPSIIKTQIEDNIPSLIDRNISLESVSVNPFSFSVKLHQFIIHSRDAQRDLAGVKVLNLNVDPFNFIFGELKVTELNLISPFFTIYKNKDGVLNFSDILDSDETNTSSKSDDKFEIPNIHIEKLAIRRGELIFIDESKSKTFSQTLKPINFTLRDFSTQHNHKNALSLHIEIDDGTYIDYRGKIKSLDPLMLSGGLELHSGRLYTQWKYFRDSLGFVVADGSLTASLNYSANLSATPIEVNVENYNFEISKLRLQDKKTKEDVLKLPHLVLNGNASLSNKSIKLNIAYVEGLFIKATRDKDGTINWIDYFPKPEEVELQKEEATTENEWKIEVAEVDIKTDELSFEEHYAKTPYKAGLSALTLGMKNIKINANELSFPKYSLGLTGIYLNELQGLEALSVPLLSINGKANILDKEIHLDEIILNDIKLQVLKDKNERLNFTKYAPYVGEKVEIVEAKEKETPWKLDITQVNISTQELSYVDLSAKKEYKAEVKTIKLEVNDIRLNDANLSVHDFNVDAAFFSLRPNASRKKWVYFENLIIKGSYEASNESNLNLNEISLKKIKVYALMDENGKINFEYLTPKKEQSEVKKETPNSVFNWEIEQFSINKSRLIYEDRFNAKDLALIRLTNINFQLHNLSSKKNTWAKSKLSMRINKTGKMFVSTRLRQNPLKIKTDFKLTSLDFVDFQPFMDKNANIDINSGKLNLDFKSQYDEKKMVLIANTQIDNLDLSERQEGKTFFSFSKLSVKEIDLTLNPDQVKIAEVNIYNPYARMKFDENRSTNFKDILAQVEDTNETNTSVSIDSTDKEAFAVFIGKVNFKDGTGEFTDLSLPLPFSTKVHELNGQMIALGTLSEIKTTVDIDGTVDKYGLMKIKGSLLSATPKKFTNMGVKFQNIDMTHLSPYTGKFIGYELEKGKMNVELEYKIEKSQMQGGNRIILNQLTLGNEVDSEDAISAPISLAIALLKDGDGVIDLDVPVEGNVDDPEFAIGHVVWTAFSNMVVGIVSSPFNFLGDMLGMDAEELAMIEFEEGKHILLPPQREKLDKLAEALKAKDLLILKVAGAYNPKIDLLSMKKAKVYEEALIKLDDETTDISKIDRDDLDDLLKEMYVVHFSSEKLEATQDTIDDKDIDSDAKTLAIRQSVINALINDQKVTQKDLENLAKRRAEGIVSHLIEQGIDGSRLELLEPAIAEESLNEYIPTKLELGAR